MKKTSRSGGVAMKMENSDRPRGFTLIELMLVVAIIGLLAAIAIPKFADMVRKSKEAALRGHLGTLRSAMSLYYVDNEGIYPWGLNFLVAGKKYLDKLPVVSLPGVPDHEDSILVNWGGPVADWAGNLLSYPPPTVAPTADPKAWWWTSNTLRVNCTHTDSKGITWSLY